MVSQLKLFVSKHFGFCKKLLDPGFEDWLLQDAVNTFIRDSSDLDRHVVRSQKAYVRLPLDGHSLFTLLLEKGPNQFNRLEPVTNRHVDVHENELVGGARFRKPVLD